MNIRSRIFRGVWLVAGLAVALFIIGQSRNRWALHLWKQELAQQGEKFAIGELVPPLPDPASNGAPELLGAMAELASAGSDLKAPVLMDFVAPGQALGSGRREACRLWTSQRHGLSTNLTWPDLAARLQSITNVLNTARHALAKPKSDFALNYYLGLELPLPHLARQKKIGRSVLGLRPLSSARRPS